MKVTGFNRVGTRKSYEDEKGNKFVDCTHCGEIKAIDNFGKNSNKSAFMGIECKCKKCRYEYHKEKGYDHTKYYYYESNKERYIDNAKRFRENNPEKCKEYTRKWVSNNPEKVKEKRLKYARNNKEVVNAGTNRYRARKASLPDTLTSEQAKLLGDKCILTGSSDIHLDHVIPLSTGYGGTTYENIIPLKAELNRSKHDRNIFEWALQNHRQLGFTMSKFNQAITEVASRNGMTLKEYREYVYKCHDKKAL